MTGASWGCQSSDKCIQQLFEAGLIDAEVASKYSKHISNEEKTDLKRSNIPFSSYGKRWWFLETFKYSALTSDGVRVKGVVDALDEYAAVDKIKAECQLKNEGKKQKKLTKMI